MKRGVWTNSVSLAAVDVPLRDGRLWRCFGGIRGMSLSARGDRLAVTFEDGQTSASGADNDDTDRPMARESNSSLVALFGVSATRHGNVSLVPVGATRHFRNDSAVLAQFCQRDVDGVTLLAVSGRSDTVAVFPIVRSERFVK